jgi:hypothetical protein
MPQIVPLQVLPNQHLTITLDQQKYDITLKTITDLTYATISVNGTKIVDSVRCIPNRPILPYQYLEGVGGNFAFFTSNDELPNYMAFGVTHTLIYASAAELAALRATGV